jgi:glycosyltransferase involved in cell wall biosynthesis
MVYNTAFAVSRARSPGWQMQIETELKTFVAAPSASLPVSADDLPMISVIVPSYNQADYLERTLLSILNQGYPKLDLIVMDGGSKDGSVEIIERYSHAIAYWQSQPDGGQTAAINAGILKARGDLVCYQNSDDLYLPGALLEAGRLAVERPEADFIAGDMLLIDADDSILDLVLMMPQIAGLTGYLGMPIVNQAAFWRPRLTDRVGVFDEEFRHTMDYEFFTRAFDAGARVAHCRSLWGAFRIHEAAKTSTQRTVWHEELTRVDKERTKLLASLPMRYRRIIGSGMKALLHFAQGERWYLTRDRYRLKT